MYFNQGRKPRLKMNITFAFLIHIWHFKKLFGMLDSIAKNGSFATTNRKSSLGFFMQEGERRAMFLICLGLLASGAWEPSTKETWAQGPFLSCNSTLFAILLGQSQGNRRTNKLLLFLKRTTKNLRRSKENLFCLLSTVFYLSNDVFFHQFDKWSFVFLVCHKV